MSQSEYLATAQVDPAVVGIFYSHAGSHRGKARVWFEGRRLARANFMPGASFSLVENNGSLVITLSGKGDRTVSSRRRRDDVQPIIDISGQTVERLFPGETRICAIFETGRITVAMHPVDQDVKARLSKLIRALSRKDPLACGSIAHGAGVLDHAIHTGLADRGVRAELTFAIEKDGSILDAAIANNPIWTSDTLAIEGPVEDVDVTLLPTIDILAAGLPCTGASVAGRAKNAIAFAEEHETAGALFVPFLQIVKACQPAVCIIENVPPFRSTASMAAIRKAMSSMGYDVHETILDGNEMGSLEIRRRFVAVAVTRGIPFDFSLIRPIRIKESTIAEIIDRDDPRSNIFRTMEGLRAKQTRDKINGKNFKMQIVTEASPCCTAIGTHYYKVRSTEPKLAAPSGNGCLRQFTPREHARLKTIPEFFAKGLSDTMAHRVMGQSVIHAAFVAVGRLIGDMLNGLETQNVN